MMIVDVLPVLAGLVYLANGSPVNLARTITPDLNVSAELQRTWAPYTPYFAAEPYQAPAQGCEVTQVNIIQRHGARFPTSGASTRIKAALAKIQSVSNYTDSRLDFLKTYTYDLGVADLVPFGAAQSFDAGLEAFQRYSNLVNSSNIPFVRASGSDRVVATAGNWTAGFATGSQKTLTPVINLIIDEAKNDTLDDSMCPSVGDSDAQTDQWLSVFAPSITANLNAAAPGANLTDADIFNLISLCPFDTVAHEKPSPFCDLFAAEKDAFSGFSYSGDLDKFYNTGYGQELGAVQGVGYINELIARLTGTPVRDNTQTNRTLDTDPATFPFNRTIYADFSHDNQMIAIFSAMGLFKQKAPLSTTEPDASRTWFTARLVPFSARMVVEKLQCGETQNVRVLVNDAQQPLEFCGTGNGICTVDAFVESQSFARNDGEGDFAKCFA
ncbi:hypothetical protein QCA50_011561 [Cerrena zonata]|uniref:Phytase A n=1 Tax=Cerrena zonata TaxID=2478898 RepID=A0AAW0FVU1_9APHY